MDKKPGEFPGDSIVVTGIGTSCAKSLLDSPDGTSGVEASGRFAHDPNPFEFLQHRKTLKFMSKQDRLALEAAGNAIEQAAIPQEILTHHTGVFLAVGYIPFELDTAAELSGGSTEDGRFSMQKFSTTGIENINPLLAFACLPNMPGHHVAMNFQIFGQYFITYPDLAQFYLALEEAVSRLVNMEIDCALVGGVADQNNFLVMHHYSKINSKTTVPAADCGAFMVLERKLSAQKRKADILMELESFDIRWQGELNTHKDRPKRKAESEVNMGPAELVLCLSSFMEKGDRDFHHFVGEGEIVASSNWKK